MKNQNKMRRIDRALRRQARARWRAIRRGEVMRRGRLLDERGEVSRWLLALNVAVCAFGIGLALGARAGDSDARSDYARMVNSCFDRVQAVAAANDDELGASASTLYGCIAAGN